MLRRMRAAILIVGLIACGTPARDGSGVLDANSGSNGSGAFQDAPLGTGGTTYVYAHTAGELYKIDPDTLARTLVGSFGWPSGSDQMTDLAIDRDGNMIGISFGSVYRVDPTNAAVTLLHALSGGTFNGLSFVPATAINQTGDDVLIATRGDDGLVFRIDQTTGVASQIGNMGSTYASSGDTVGIDNFGVLQTVQGSPNDVLVRLAPGTFTATPIGTNTGFGQIYGIGFWKNQIFGFTVAGDFIKIDAATGVGVLVEHTGLQWYGAAVTTIAPVIQ